MKIRLYLSLRGDLAYTEIPKCAISTTKQYLHLIGTGAFREDIDINRSKTGLLRWKYHRAQMLWRLARRKHRVFTCVRNPYGRLVSAFFDKVVNLQADGLIYGRPELRQGLESYGVVAGGDPVETFRRFVVFARDTIVHRRPLGPDMHWMPMAWLAAAPMRLGLAYDDVLRVESYEADFVRLLEDRFPETAGTWTPLRAFNEAPGAVVKRTLPVADYFDATSRLLTEEAYAEDFAAFGYSTDPAVREARPMAVAEINAALKTVRLRGR